MLRAPQPMWRTMLYKSWPFYGIVIFILCLGIAVGSLTAYSMSGLQAGELEEFLNLFIKQMSSLKINNLDLIKASVFNNALLIVLIYFLGLTVIGIPIMLALIFGRGFILGFAVGFLFREKAFRGIVLAVAAILPQNLLYLPALIVGGATTLYFTLLLVKKKFNANTKIWPVFLCYNGMMLAVVTVAFGSSLIEAYITPGLTKFAVKLIS